MPNKIKLTLEKGKYVDIHWEDIDKDKLNSLIYYSICIENNIKEINLIDLNMKESSSNIYLEIKFSPEEVEVNKFIENIKKFGNILQNDNKLKLEKIEEENKNKKIEEIVQMFDEEFATSAFLGEDEFREKIIELNYNEEKIREWIEMQL